MSGVNDGPEGAAAPGVWGESQNWAGIHGVSHALSAAGVAGVNDNGGDGVQGIGHSGSGFVGNGVHGIGFDADGVGVLGEAHNGATAIGIQGISNTGYAGLFGGRVLINGSLFVTGNLTVFGSIPKSAAVPHPDGSHRRLYCQESPESWFEDFGFGRLVNGRVHIALDPDFAALVDTDAYHVFVTEYDGHGSLAVFERTITGFDVRAMSPTASSQFSYRIVAKRKDLVAPRLERVTLPALPDKSH
jgi:hypothetical protein